MNEFPNFKPEQTDEQNIKTNDKVEEQGMSEEETICEHPLGSRKYTSKEEHDSTDYYKEQINKLKK